ncbi:MAG: carbon-nitrogen hydrolase family protein [Candidatus Omnitrophica bacterium]|nr:carbon-nitrogen hydrolase family protein [Candidatus Omnitrophota bacterium]
MKTAVIQLNAGPDKEKNIAKAVFFVEKAAVKQAGFICLPEAFCYRGPTNTKAFFGDIAETLSGDTVTFFSKIAKEKKIAVLLGSIYEKSKQKNRVYNTSVLINSQGKVVAKYRKRNLFHAKIGKTKIQESDIFLAGKTSSVAMVRGWKVGLSVCYDLRFPQMYQDYAKKGCQVLTVPSSFTHKTGQAHWEVLLRARAIENKCYVVAPNQVGKDGSGVVSYGNSMIVSPWGKVLARASEKKEQIIYAEIKKEEIKIARKILP